MNCQCGSLSINQVKAKEVNITVNQGDDFSALQFDFWEDAEKTVPIDITSNTYQIRVFSGSQTKLILATEIIAPNILQATTGKITLSAISYSWDLKQTDGDGHVITYIYGKFNVINK